MSHSSPVTVIHSRDNSFVKDLKRLAQDNAAYRKQGRVWLEGDHLCRAFLARGGRPRQAVIGAGAWLQPGPRELALKADEISVLDDSLLPEVSSLESPAPIGFLIDGPVKGQAPLANVATVVLDRLQDPGNVGTILRTADAFDCDGVFLVNACADPYSPKTARATMGAVFRRDVYQCTADELCALLQKSNLPLYGTALRNDTVSLRDAELSRAAVAIGSEGRGLSAEILSKCEKTIKIPMSPRCESLNAAVAASVVLWEMYR